MAAGEGEAGVDLGAEVVVVVVGEATAGLGVAGCAAGAAAAGRSA